MRSDTDIALDIHRAALDLWLDGFDTMTVEDIRSRCPLWDTDRYHRVLQAPRGIPNLDFKWPREELDVKKLTISVTENGKRSLIDRLNKKLNEIERAVRKPI